MTNGLKVRDTQTCVKHEILEGYLNKWAGIISQGRQAAAARTGRVLDLHLVYVDCFAYRGKYAGDREAELNGDPLCPVYGSPVIGIRTLDKFVYNSAANCTDLRISSNVILVEENPKTYSGLLETLSELGWSARIKPTTRFASLAAGDIAVVNADCVSLADMLLEYTRNDPDTFAFYLLDPYGPKGIPYSFVRSIASRQRHDVMINLIYLDLLRKTGMALKKSRTCEEQQLVDHWTAAFGSSKWIDIAKSVMIKNADQEALSQALANLNPDDSADEALLGQQTIQSLEAQVAIAYRDVLKQMDSSLATKMIDLWFAEKDRVMLYLFLTTHDPTGALALNEVLDDAKMLESELRIRVQLARAKARTGQMTFLDASILAQDKPPRPPTEEVADRILSRLRGQTVEKREVYRQLADEPYYESEVKKALTYLRKQRKASYDTSGRLRNSTVITFAMA
jgi:three-Cys-motif partner protein